MQLYYSIGIEINNKKIALRDLRGIKSSRPSHEYCIKEISMIWIISLANAEFLFKTYFVHMFLSVEEFSQLCRSYCNYLIEILMLTKTCFAALQQSILFLQNSLSALDFTH